MPSGGIRVDENTLGFAKEADEFLAIASSGCSARDIPIFWRELSCDPERVQRYRILNTLHCCVKWIYFFLLRVKSSEPKLL